MRPFVIAATAAVLVHGTAMAQTAPPSKSKTFSEALLLGLFERNNLSTLCLEKGMSATELVEAFRPHLSPLTAEERDSMHAVTSAIFTAFPCPFSPQRPELSPARKEDLVGYWLFPRETIHLKFGSASPAWKQYPANTPWKCEGISFIDSGRYHVMGMLANGPCPTAAALKSMEAFPNVQSWELIDNGKVRITRTDVPEAWEEWDIYRVTKPFTVKSVGRTFEQGDLLAYQRASKNNPVNIAEQFRHLRRLN